MSLLATSFARRSVEFAHGHLTKVRDGGDGDGDVEIEIPPGVIALFAITILAFSVLLFAIHYTYGNVVGTLTIVENPQPDAYVPVNQSDENEEEADIAKPPPPAYSAVDQEVVLIKTKPITSSIRSTIQHLRSRTGTYWSRFRGFSLFICWTFVRSLLVMAIGSFGFLRNFYGMGIAQICAEVILARWELTWYHIVMSEPSPKKWWQRVPTFSSSWTKIAPAVALRSLAQRISSGFPVMLAGSFGPMKRLQDPSFEPGMKDVNAAFGQSLMVIFLTISLFVLLEIPAIVTVVRVASSMLPEEDEAIVPFDRSFGGKVTPAIIGGAGKIGMLEAWRSFTWASRVRLLKLVVKVCAIMTAVSVLFLAVVVAEANIFLGDQLPKMMNSKHPKPSHP